MMTPEYIKFWRNYLGMTQSEFAEHLGYHLRSIPNWEMGRFKPNKRVDVEFIKFAKKEKSKLLDLIANGNEDEDVKEKLAILSEIIK